MNSPRFAVLAKLADIHNAGDYESASQTGQD